MASSATINIANEGNVTPEFIMNEAIAIYKKCKEIWSGKRSITEPTGEITIPGEVIDPYNEQKHREIFEVIFATHKQFCQAYPTVAKHIAFQRWFSKKAFSMYLIEVTNHPWKDDETRIASYAKYYE